MYYKILLYSIFLINFQWISVDFHENQMPRWKRKWRHSMEYEPKWRHSMEYEPILLLKKIFLTSNDFSFLICLSFFFISILPLLEQNLHVVGVIFNFLLVYIYGFSRQLKNNDLLIFEDPIFELI